MRCAIVILFLISISYKLFSQDIGFKNGATYRDLDTKEYAPDTTAVAVVLNEFGYARFDNGNDYNLLVDYHVKIKILKKEGLRYGDFEIPLFKRGLSVEFARDIKATSYRYVNGSMVASELDQKTIITENTNKHVNVKKVAIPNVTVGSVIEYSYTIETPFIFNFRTWEFQSDIPKIYSEYWADIPVNYVYNISLRGFLKLDKNESKAIRECFGPGGANQSDCSRLMWGMKNIPAFVEEEYMTASKNYISAIRFELSEFHSFSGVRDNITKDWKDVAEELKQNESFGGQLRKAKGVIDTHIEQLTTGETDPLAKAKKIYGFVRDWYQWNGELTKYSDEGIKKAFEMRKGNSGDINLTLIAALKYAGLTVDPVILSTRNNGTVTSLHPVLADFNYVVARLVVGEKVYLLDATDPFAPFGLLPERCLNGQGRVLAEKETFWHDLKATDKEKRVVVANLAVTDDGRLKGSVEISHFGYSAVGERKTISDAGDEKEYIKDLADAWNFQSWNFEVTAHEILNVRDIARPLVVKLQVEAPTFDLLFNPIVAEKWSKNPFKSTERLYPVDFGAPLDETFILNLQHPPTYSLSEIVGKVGVALPNNGGRFIYEVNQIQENKITVTSTLQVSKAVFSPEEYHYLREIFNRVVSAHQNILVFTKK
jgi:hypothetical protein